MMNNTIYKGKVQNRQNPVSDEIRRYLTEYSEQYYFGIKLSRAPTKSDLIRRNSKYYYN